MFDDDGCNVFVGSGFKNGEFFPSLYEYDEASNALRALRTE